jgi:hypothetical protein
VQVAYPQQLLLIWPAAEFRTLRLVRLITAVYTYLHYKQLQQLACKAEQPTTEPEA